MVVVEQEEGEREDGREEDKEEERLRGREAEAERERERGREAERERQRGREDSVFDLLFSGENSGSNFLDLVMVVVEATAWSGPAMNPDDHFRMTILEARTLQYPFLHSST